MSLWGENSEITDKCQWAEDGSQSLGLGDPCLEQGTLTHGQVAVETTKFEFPDLRLDQPSKFKMLPTMQQ